MAELLTNAAEGMFSLIGQADFRPSELRPLSIQISLKAEGSEGEPSYEQLLHQWLRRLLQEFNLHCFFPVQFQVSVTSSECSATVKGGSFDLAKHTFQTEIKGVTWHGLKVAKMNSGWEAEVIFDV